MGRCIEPIALWSSARRFEQNDGPPERAAESPIPRSGGRSTEGCERSATAWATTTAPADFESCPVRGLMTAHSPGLPDVQSTVRRARLLLCGARISVTCSWLTARTFRHRAGAPQPRRSARSRSPLHVVHGREWPAATANPRRTGAGIRSRSRPWRTCAVTAAPQWDTLLAVRQLHGGTRSRA